MSDEKHNPPKKLNDNELCQKFDIAVQEGEGIINGNAGKGVIWILCLVIDKYLEILESHIDQARKIKKITTKLQEFNATFVKALPLGMAGLLISFEGPDLQKTHASLNSTIKKMVAIKKLFGETVVRELYKTILTIGAWIKIESFMHRSFTTETSVDPEIYTLLEGFKDAKFSYWKDKPVVAYECFKNIKTLLWYTQDSDAEAYQKINKIFLACLENLKNHCSLIKSDAKENEIKLLILYLILAGREACVALSPELKTVVQKFFTSDEEIFDEEFTYYCDIYYSAVMFFDYFDKLPLPRKIIELDKLSGKLKCLNKGEDDFDAQYILVERMLELLEISMKKMGAFSFGKIPGKNHIDYLMNVFQLASLLYQASLNNDDQAVVAFFDKNSVLIKGSIYPCIPLLFDFYSKHPEKAKVIGEKLFDRLVIEKNYLVQLIDKEVSCVIYPQIEHMLSVIIQKENLSQVRTLFGSRLVDEIMQHVLLVRELQIVDDFLELEKIDECDEESQGSILEKFETLNFNFFVSYFHLAYRCYFGFEKYLSKQKNYYTQLIEDRLQKIYEVFQQRLLRSLEAFQKDVWVSGDVYLAFLYIFIKGPEVAGSELEKIMRHFKKYCVTDNKDPLHYVKLMDAYLALLDYFLFDTTSGPEKKQEKLKNLLEKLKIFKNVGIIKFITERIYQGFGRLLDYIVSKKPQFSVVTTSSASTVTTNALEKFEFLCHQEEQYFLKREEVEKQVEDNYQKQKKALKLVPKKLKSNEQSIERNNNKMRNSQEVIKKHENRYKEKEIEIKSCNEKLNQNEKEMERCKEEMIKNEGIIKQAEETSQDKQEKIRAHEDEWMINMLEILDNQRMMNVYDKVRDKCTKKMEEIKQEMENIERNEERIRGIEEKIKQNEGALKRQSDQNRANLDIVIERALVYYRIWRMNKNCTSGAYHETYCNAVKKIFMYLSTEFSDKNFHDPEVLAEFLNKFYPQERERFSKHDIFVAIAEYYEENKLYEKAVEFYTYYKDHAPPPVRWKSSRKNEQDVYKIKLLEINKRREFCEKQTPNPANVPGTLVSQQFQIQKVTTTSPLKEDQLPDYTSSTSVRGGKRQ